jgi:thymidylate synthase (FAD)
MKVNLLAYTPNPERVVAAAARCCYSNDDPDELMDGMTDEKAATFVEKLAELHHESPMEHVSFTFSISGVSRSLLAQISRHRLASFSVRSQRYCDMGQADYVTPPALQGDMQACFEGSMVGSAIVYKELLVDGAKKEDARFVLPEATCTAMVVTMNARELLHFFSLRMCCHAQWEIQQVANEMCKLVKQVAPNLFAKAGAACQQLGYCPEGRRSCGKAPTLGELKREWTNRNG